MEGTDHIPIRTVPAGEAVYTTKPVAPAAGGTYTTEQHAEPRRQIRIRPVREIFSRYDASAVLNRLRSGCNASGFQICHGTLMCAARARDGIVARLCASDVCDITANKRYQTQSLKYREGSYLWPALGAIASLFILGTIASWGLPAAVSGVCRMAGYDGEVCFFARRCLGLDIWIHVASTYWISWMHDVRGSYGVAAMPTVIFYVAHGKGVCNLWRHPAAAHVWGRHGAPRHGEGQERVRAAAGDE